MEGISGGKDFHLPRVVLPCEDFLPGYTIICPKHLKAYHPENFSGRFFDKGVDRIRLRW